MANNSVRATLFNSTSRSEAIATQASEPSKICTLIEEMMSYMDSSGNERHRLLLLRLARSLVQALETPRETVLRLCWAEVRIHSRNDSGLTSDCSRLYTVPSSRQLTVVSSPT